MAGLQGGDRLEGHSIEIIMTNPELDSHITISQLPSEVLLLIFRRYSMTEWRGGDVPWIKVTHVCRRWREVALSASTLWSYIRITPSTSAKRVSTWIQRSQQAPLTVTSLPVSFFEMEVTEIHRIIMEHLTRIRELALYVLDIELFHPNSLAGPHHSLQNLTIDFVPHATAGYPGLPSISKLHTIFPSLSVLSLSHFHLDLDACQFPASLTSLRLFEGVPQSHVSLERMLDVLRGLPLLTSFALGSGKLSEITTATATSISSVSLPHLRYLNIAEQLHPCIGLLAHLIVPTGIQYSLRLLMTSESMPLLSTDAAVITSWMNRINRPSQCARFEPDIPSRDLDDPDVPDSFTLKLGDDIKSLVTFNPENVSKVTLEEADPPVDGFWDESPMDSFFSRVDYSKVTTLFLRDFEGRMDETFSKMPNVETLYIQGSADYSVSTSTGFLTYKRYPHPSVPLIFPRLRVLQLHQFCFTRYPEPDPVRDAEGDVDQVIFLRSVLNDRAQAGYNLDTLVLGGCQQVTLEDFQMAGCAVRWATEEDKEAVHDRSARSVDSMEVRERLLQQMARNVVGMDEEEEEEVV